MRPRPLLAFPALALALCLTARAATPPPPPPGPGDRMFAEYFRTETARLTRDPLAGIDSAAAWRARLPAARAELQEMLGLLPFPERTPLQATITGRLEHPEFTVEKLHFQSLPGLYVTANLYLPRDRGDRRVPAILYVCGHAVVKEGGVSFGNKAGYQHHGAWFARHGYACLLIDTIQLGELEGVHHGTHRLGLHAWNARGYTPAGVEAWNGIRALDYLQSRPEIDPERIGMTGRSGGGAYTWYTAALDERVRAAVPVAGITDLHNHVVDGVIKGHCDCMFTLNSSRWDFAAVAALVAPRPLLIANTDKDPIFPLDGVQRIHRAVAGVYRLLGAADRLGLLITEGPHKDTQDLQVPAFRWFNRFLKGEDPPIRVAAEKLFAPRDLRVFPVGGHPADERTTKIHDTFVPLAAPALPTDAAAWARQRDGWRDALRTRVFAGWPAAGEAGAPDLRPTTRRTTAGRVETTWEFTSQGVVRLPLRGFSRGEPGTAPRLLLQALDEQAWAAGSLAPELAAAVDRGELEVLQLAPRGIGPTAPTAPAADQNQLRRRHPLLGQTLEGMRVWDIRRAAETLRAAPAFAGKPLTLAGVRDQAVNALYASLHVDGLAEVELEAPPASHLRGPDYLHVLRFLDVPQAVALAAERQPVRLRGANPDDWSWPARAAAQLGWPDDRLR